MVGYMDGMALASGTGVVISNTTPRAVATSFIVVFLVMLVAFVVCFFRSGGFKDSGDSALAIALFVVLSPLATVLLGSAVVLMEDADVEASNESAFMRHYGISDMDIEGTGSYAPAHYDTLDTPDGRVSTVAKDNRLGALLLSGTPTRAYSLSFADLGDVHHKGYLVISGNRATLYVKSDASKTTSGTGSHGIHRDIEVVAYTESSASAPSSSELTTTTAGSKTPSGHSGYDYGRLR